MLGAVVALRRGQHMRMTALVGVCSGRVRSILEAIGVAAPALFLLLILHPAYNIAEEETFIVNAGAGDSATPWRAAALPVGVVLMLIAAGLLRCADRCWRDIALAVVILAAVAGRAFWLVGPWLQALGNWNLLIFFVVLLGLGRASPAFPSPSPSPWRPSATCC